jgi:hypothetical protein
MYTLEIPATCSTPAVIFDGKDKLLIEGRSFPEDVDDFYRPLIEWTANLEINSLLIDINLEYINSASSKLLLHILKLLDANQHIAELSVNWRYEEGDEDVLESGQIYEELLFRTTFRYYEYKDAA